jgi:16S rRNA (guanine527-N7)-methyltransferase
MKTTCPGAWAELPARARRLFGIELQAHELEAFDHYLRILEQWSTRMNLVAARSRDEIIDRHLIDSLALARWARAARVAVDLGSGAGFPGVPLAVIAPRVRFHLVESRTKRSSFLRHVARTIGLRNVEIWEASAETWKIAENVDLVVARAISIDILGLFARRVLASGGRLVAMRKSGGPPIGLEGFAELESVSYRLPGGENHQAVAFERIA